MKTVLIIIFSFSTLLGVKAQDETKNFSIESNSLIWQKVYETDLNFEELQTAIKEAGTFEYIEVSENSIIGDVKPFRSDYKSAGYSTAMAPIIVARSDNKGFAIIEYKEGKYRITFKNLKFKQRSTDPLFEKGEETTLEEMAIKKGEFKKSFLKATATILNYSFSEHFKFEKPVQNDNW
jgi:hypothetical protein